MEDKINILIIEDDPAFLKMLRQLLKRIAPAAQIEEAGDCVTAIKKLENQSFDCALLDHNLPDGYGTDLLQEFQCQTDGSIPVIFMTAQGDENLAVSALKKGASDYIPKDKMTADTLERSIRTTLKTHELDIRARQAEHELFESERQHRSILNRMADIVFRLDTERKISQINAGCRQLGYRPNDLLGHPIEQLIEYDGSEETLSTIATRRFDERATRDFPVNFKTLDGDTRPVSLSSFGLWNLPNDIILQDNAEKQFVETLCFGRFIESPDSALS